MSKATLTPEEKLLIKKEKELRKQAGVLQRQLRASQKKPKGKKQAQGELLDYIINKYGIVYIPPQISKKLLAINEGTYTGLTQPISFEDLLEMFKYFNAKLEQAKRSKRSKGERLDSVSQINYDLAIILNNANQYYDYLQSRKETLEKAIDATNYKLEKNIATQDIAKKKQRLAELEKIKNERDEANLEELFEDF